MGDKYGGTPLIWPTAMSYNSLDDLTRRALPRDSGKLAEMMRDPNVRVFVRLPPEDAGRDIASPPYDAARHDAASAAEYCNVCENFPCLGGHPGPAEG